MCADSDISQLPLAIAEESVGNPMALERIYRKAPSMSDQGMQQSRRHGQTNTVGKKK
jgi:hypothetical protein